MCMPGECWCTAVFPYMYNVHCVQRELVYSMKTGLLCAKGSGMAMYVAQH